MGDNESFSVSAPPNRNWLFAGMALPGGSPLQNESTNMESRRPPWAFKQTSIVVAALLYRRAQLPCATPGKPAPMPSISPPGSLGPRTPDNPQRSDLRRASESPAASRSTGSFRWSNTEPASCEFLDEKDVSSVSIPSPAEPFSRATLKAESRPHFRTTTVRQRVEGVRRLRGAGHRAAGHPLLMSTRPTFQVSIAFAIICLTSLRAFDRTVHFTQFVAADPGPLLDSPRRCLTAQNRRPANSSLPT